MKIFHNTLNQMKMETIKEPLLLNRDQDKAEYELSVRIKHIKVINHILGEFTKLEIGEIKSKEDIKSLLQDPRGYCMTLISDQLPESSPVAGLKIPKKKLMELVKPEGLESFVVLTNGSLKELSEDCYRWNPVIHFRLDYETFNLKDNTVYPVKDLQSNILKKYSVYVDSEEKERVYNAVIEFEKQFVELRNLLKGYGCPIRLDYDAMQALIGTNENSGETRLNKVKLTNIIRSIK